MAFLGFNPDEVRESIGRVNSAYESLIQQVGVNTQNEFINGMADKWACQQAQKFFSDCFKPVIDSLIASINETFESINASMNSAAEAWARDTDSTYSPTNLDIRNITMDASPILENISGIRGIDLDLARTVTDKLKSIQSESEAALNNARSAVNNCGFVGGDMESSLISSLETIKQSINDDVVQITQESASAIESTITEYSDLAGKISQAFQGN